MGCPNNNSERKKSIKKFECQKVAKISNNGYLNFLREYKKCCCGMSPQDTVRAAAKAWNRLTCSQREYYKRLARSKKSSNSKCDSGRSESNNCSN